MWSERGPLRYERLTWPEVRRAAAEERVALVPVATLEDHGPHLAAAAFYLASPEAAAVIERVRDSTRGGMAHACELETSIYLAIDPDAVAMDLAVDERGYPEGEHAWLDWSDGSLKLMPCGRRSAGRCRRAAASACRRRPAPRRTAPTCSVGSSGGRPAATG